MRYLSQRYAMPFKMAKGTLTDIGTEELAHMEIVAAIIHQLTRNLTKMCIRDSYTPLGMDHKDPYRYPGKAADLSGLPPDVYKRQSPPVPKSVPPKYLVTTTQALQIPSPKSTSRIGRPAVPEGSPSSLQRVTGFFSPITKAEQWCLSLIHI